MVLFLHFLKNKLIYFNKFEPEKQFLMLEDQKDDIGLLQDMREDKASGFEAIYRKYWRRLFAIVISKTNNEELAKEIVQEIFISLWEKRHESMIINLEHYLMRALRNKIIDSFRQRKFETLDSRDPEDTGGSHFQWVDETESIINAKINDLPEKTRQIIILNKIEGKSPKEISKELDIPQRTVEHHITTGVRQLQEKLKKYLNYTLLLPLYFLK